MGVGKRKVERKPRRIRIRYGIDDTSSFIGYTSNVSRKGIRLEGRRRYLPQTRLWLEIGECKVRLWGTVRWTRQVSVQFVNAGILNSMGICFDLPAAQPARSAVPRRAESARLANAA